MKSGKGVQGEAPRREHARACTGRWLLPPGRVPRGLALQRQLRLLAGGVLPRCSGWRCRSAPHHQLQQLVHNRGVGRRHSSGAARRWGRGRHGRRWRAAGSAALGTAARQALQQQAHKRVWRLLLLLLLLRRGLLPLPRLRLLLRQGLQGGRDTTNWCSIGWRHGRQHRPPCLVPRGRKPQRRRTGEQVPHGEQGCRQEGAQPPCCLVH